MPQGTIKFYDPARAFGFIEQDAGGDVFFHKNNCVDVLPPHEDDRVEFDVTPSRRYPDKLQAKDVKVIGRD